MVKGGREPVERRQKLAVRQTRWATGGRISGWPAGGGRSATGREERRSREGPPAIVLSCFFFFSCA